jgi:SAM-dependent methyltransferase
VRHRLLIAALSQIDWLSYGAILQGKRVLHFAPEPQIAKSIFSVASEYTTADFLVAHADLRLDISHMESIDNDRYDVVIACDVLEHVLEHKRALDEIGRVLSANGIAILTVPQPDGLETSFEDPTVVSPEDRERVFGQFDHVRLYGPDFPELVEAAGFRVTVIDETNFSQEQVEKNVLFPPERLPNPLATNYRKVFFARKQSVPVIGLNS